MNQEPTDVELGQLAMEAINDPNQPTIRSIFEEECADLVIDGRFIKRLSEYRFKFTTKNQDHIEFFGGNLLGVQVVRFLPADKDAWFDDIIQANDAILEDRLHALPTISPEHMLVASDVFNLSCAWLLHAIYVSPKLNDKQKHDGMIDVALVMQYKFMTSRLYRHFKYPADVATAKATYAQLSYKFAIKVHGNWNAVLEARAEEIISKTGIHFQAVSKMETDESVIYLINDSQGRIRDMIKNIYDVFLRVHNQGQRITTTSSVIEHDGESMLKDQTKAITAYSRYLNSIVSDKKSFIRQDLASVITQLMDTMSPDMFKKTLEWMSDNYQQRGAGDIEFILNETIIHAFHYFSQNKTVIRKTSDLPTILSKLKGSYGASRSSDPVLLNMREKTEKMVRIATGSKHPGLISAARTGVLLYVVARALTMKHYTKQ